LAPSGVAAAAGGGVAGETTGADGGADAGALSGGVAAGCDSIGAATGVALLATVVDDAALRSRSAANARRPIPSATMTSNAAIPTR
jgi:hypothetical protein